MSYLKVEDVNGVYRPQFRIFERFPCINVANTGAVFTPAEFYQRGQGTKCSNIMAPAKYCEICDERYFKLKAHLNSIQHRKAVDSNRKNFLELDKTIAQVQWFLPINSSGTKVHPNDVCHIEYVDPADAPRTQAVNPVDARHEQNVDPEGEQTAFFDNNIQNRLLRDFNALPPHKLVPYSESENENSIVEEVASPVKVSLCLLAVLSYFCESGVY